MAKESVNKAQQAREETPETTKNTVRSVFGRELDLDAVNGMDVKELLAVHQDTLKVEDGDPNYEYGWMDTRDPACQVKLRKGFWELVSAETDQVIAPGGIKQDDHTFHVNELTLVRMRKDLYKKLRDAEVALALRKEQAVQQQFHGNIKDLTRSLSDSGDPFFETQDAIRKTTLGTEKAK